MSDELGAKPHDNPLVQQIEPRPKNRQILRRGLAKGRKLIWRSINKFKYAELGAGSWIKDPLLVTGEEQIRIGKNVFVWPMARLETIRTSNAIGEIVIGDDSVIHPFVHIGASLSVTIGKKCLFASGVYITDHDHDWTNPDVPVIDSSRLLAAPVEIGDGVWLGERVAILKGVSIGDGAIIGTGAVVTQNIPSYSIAVGSPARVVKHYDRDTKQWK